MSIVNNLMCKQNDAMKSKWPKFRLSSRLKSSGILVWTGELSPQYEVYKVEITVDFNSALFAKKPEIRVISPKLKQIPDNPEGKLPHVYWRKNGDFVLCLYDPAASEWHNQMLVADTLVPWTIDWLTCYEDWLLTGAWHGGGRHEKPLINEGN